MVPTDTKSRAAAAVAGLLVVAVLSGCAGDPLGLGPDTPTTPTTPKVPATRVRVITGWTDGPDDDDGSYSAVRVIQINGRWCVLQAYGGNGYEPALSPLPEEACRPNEH